MHQKLAHIYSIVYSALCSETYIKPWLVKLSPVHLEG